MLGKWLMVSGQPDGGGQVGNKGLGFDLDSEYKKTELVISLFSLV